MKPQLLLAALTLASLSRLACAQAECNGWGDFRGIRLDGQLFDFASSVRMASPGWKDLALSATEMVRNPRFSRTATAQTSSATIGFKINDNTQTLSYTQIVTDTAPGTAKVDITATANADLTLEGTYYFINLPAAPFKGATITPEGVDIEAAKMPPKIGDPLPNGVSEYYRMNVKGVSIQAAHRQIEITTDDPREFVVKNDKFIDTDYQTIPGMRLPPDPAKQDLIAIYFTLGKGNLARGQSVHAAFTIKVAGDIDKSPATLALDLSKTGAPFEGIGGNFRIQGAQDPAHIQYNLDHLRIAWGRVQMPLSQWQPQENTDPAAAADATAAGGTTPAGGRRGGGGGGGGGGAVQQAMNMAKTLADKKIPFIISTWDVPNRALAPNINIPDKPAGIQARKVNPAKWDAVYKSIASYLTYLKKTYNAEPDLFSFNESDLGINVLQTPEEHRDLIKGLGAYLAAQGLKTKMLLGDACSPHPVKFIDPAMADPDAVKYIGAISFHAWHDGTPAEFTQWSKAAEKLKVPLLCGEGGTDADAYRYTQIFAEPWFALNEIDTYLQMMQYGKTASILHWQLTENYSVLTPPPNARGNVTADQLQPTRRFFQLQQLNLTPQGAPWVQITTDHPDITCAAYADPIKNTLAIHLINNGPTRETTINGIPTTIKSLHAYATDQKQQMSELPPVPVTNGTAKITAQGETLLTLVTGG